LGDEEVHRNPGIEVAVSDNESINDALIECVKACGGSKVVGMELWPSKGMEPAQRYLLDCLNTERPAKLSPEEVLHIFRMARERGCHAGMQYMAAFLSYSMPTPVEPKDEAGELQRQFIEATHALARMAERIERLQQQGQTSPLRAAA